MIWVYMPLAYVVIGALTAAFVVHSDWCVKQRLCGVDCGTSVLSFLLWPLFWCAALVVWLEYRHSDN